MNTVHAVRLRGANGNGSGRSVDGPDGRLLDLRELGHEL